MINNITFDQERSLAIFIHIPKSGGTSFVHSIFGGKNYQGSTQNPFSWHGTSEELKRIPDEVKQKIKFLTGHSCFGAHEAFFKPSVYFSIIRHPVDRIISRFYQLTFALGDHLPKNEVQGEFLTEETLNKLLNFTNIKIHQEEINRSTTMLSGNLTSNVDKLQLEQAKNNINKYFSFICCTEDLDNYWNLISNKFGYQWRTDSEEEKYKQMHIDHNTIRPKLEEVPLYIRDQIAKTHYLDVQLYEYVKSVQDTVNNREIIYCSGKSNG